MSKADDLRDAARKSYQDAEESFQRCDTDGFVSQWASGLNGAVLNLQADIEENDGKSWFTVLTEIETGRMLEARIISTRYGASWILSDKEEAEFGRKFVPVDDSDDLEDPDGLPGNRRARRSRVQKDLGLIQSQRLMKAKAKIVGGSGRGLSGASTCYAGVVCIDDEYWGWQD